MGNTLDYPQKISTEMKQTDNLPRYKPHDANTEVKDCYSTEYLIHIDILSYRYWAFTHGVEGYSESYSVLKDENSIFETLQPADLMRGTVVTMSTIGQILVPWTVESTYRLLCMQNDNLETFLHLAAKIRSSRLLHGLLASLDGCDEYSLYSLLHIVDGGGNTLVDLAIENGVSSAIVEFVLHSAGGILLIAVEDIFIADFVTQYRDNKISKFVKFFELIVNTARSEDLFSMLSRTDKYLRTVLHQAALLGILKILDIVSKSKLSSSEKSQLYSKKDHCGNCMLHYLVTINLESCNYVLQAIFDNLEVGDKYDILSQRNRYDETVVHIAASRRVTTPIIQYLISSFSYDSYFYQLFYTINGAGLTVCHQLALKESTDLLENVVANISAEKVTQLLTIPTKHEGQSILHILARLNLPKSISRILKYVPEPKDRITLLLQADNDFLTPFHYLVISIVSECCRDLKGLINLLLLIPPSQKHKLLQSRNRNGFTVMHFAADCPSTKLLEVMLRDVPSECLLQLITLPDLSGETPFMSAVKTTRAFTAEYLFNKVEVEKRKELVLVQDLNGRDSLYWAKNQHHSSIYQQMLDIANTHLENSLAVERSDKSKNAESDQHIFPIYIRDILNAGLVTIAHVNSARIEQVYQVTTPTLTRQFRNESARLLSFQRYKSSCMPRLPLAVAGFVYFKDTADDEVLCVWCHLKLYNFIEYVNAMAIHRAYSNNVCQFVKNKSQESTADLTYGSAEQHRHVGVKVYSNVTASTDEGYDTMSLDITGSFTSGTLSSGSPASGTLSSGSPTSGTLSSGSPASGTLSSGSPITGRPTTFLTNSHMGESSSLAMDETDRGTVMSTDSIDTTNGILTMATESSEQCNVALSVAREADELEVDDAQVIIKRYQDFCQPRFSIDDELWKAMTSRCRCYVGSNMKFEVSRIHSFLNQGCKRQVAEDFATAGFFLSNSETAKTVVCAFCNGKFSMVDEDNTSCSPLEMHRQKFPSCLFIQGLKLPTRGKQPASTVNIAHLFGDSVWNATFKQAQRRTVAADFEGLGIQTTQAVCPALGVLDRRKDTFRTFPHGQPKGVEELAEAGYYYEGNGMSVTCFACAVISNHWTAGEDVWKRHARSSSSCPYLLLKKGPEFIRAAIEELGIYRTPDEVNKLTQVANRMLRPRMDSIVVQKTLAMGYDRNLVRTVIANRLKKLAPDYTSVADLVEDVLAMKEPDIQSIIGTRLPVLPEMLSRPSTQLISHIHVDREVEEQSTPAPEGAATNTQELEVEPMQNLETDAAVSEAEPESASQVISQLTCKVCISDIISIIFLPCGHFACCTSCSAAMTDCPICRRAIVGTIKANFN